MSNQILKPKHLSTYVPGVGVINKSDFTDEHLKACVEQVKKAGLDVDEYLKSRFEVASFKDMPLFVESGEPKPKSKGKAKKSEDEEAELQRLIDEEESQEKAKQKKAPE